MQRPEQQIQKAVLAHLKTRGVPSILYFHVPSGGYRRPIEAAIFTSLGAIPGIPDLIIIKAGHCFALELKAEKGRLSDNQNLVLARLKECGATCAVAYGLDAAIKTLENWALLRGKAA
jgi:hypothetical protein